MLYISLSASLTDGSEKFKGFNSKTPYFYHVSQEDCRQSPSECHVVHINLLARHGTRHPSTNDVNKINRMAQLINNLYTAYGNFTFNKVKFPWVNPFTQSDDKSLAEKGEEEHYNISQRFRRRYPEFFKAHNSSKEFRFVSTQTSRTLKSAMAFSIGLLEGTGKLGRCGIRSVEIESRAIHNDTILRFFDICPKYINTVSKNRQALKEHHDFKLTQHMNNVVEYVRQQFGNSQSIMAKHVIGMAIACAFEYAVFDRDDTWCAVFRPEDLDVLEYYYDLKHFWKRGWGHDINHQMACPLLSAILTDIESYLDVNNIHRKAGVFRFAHGETLQPLYCLLGLFKDNEILRADSYHRHHLYRANSICPFAANIAFVVYKCSGDGSSTDDNVQIEVLVNELPVSLPCCDSRTKCPWAEFLQCFDGIRKNCDFERICAEHNKDEL